MKRIAIVVLVVAVSVFGVYSIFFNSDEAKEISNESAVEGVVEESAPGEPESYKVLSGNEYKTLFLDGSHPNTTVIVNTPSITGSDEADQVIAEIALDRGYVLQEVPKQDLNMHDGFLVQDRLYGDWEGLVEEASASGHELNIESAFRPIDEQIELFMGAVNASGITISEIINRSADPLLDQIMKTVAPPGYSRHHSGYVIDISDSSSSVFEYSEGFEWISANNYLKAKEFGFIPSYPEGADNQGPNPEVWEYVWVGRSQLVE